MSRFQDKETTWRWRSDRECWSHCRVSHSSPSGRVKSCAHTPAQQSWKATVKWKMQNQRNGLTPGQGGLLSGSCSNDRIELSTQISAWKHGDELQPLQGFRSSVFSSLHFTPPWARLCLTGLWFRFELCLCDCCSAKRKVRMENCEELCLARI